jgi:hypothetical protein
MEAIPDYGVQAHPFNNGSEKPKIIIIAATCLKTGGNHILFYRAKPFLYYFKS